MSDHELIDQMAAFERCVRHRDVALAASVLASDYALVLVQPEPAVMPRARWLEVLPDYVVHSWDLEERVVDERGEVAAVLQRVAMVATVLGSDRSGVFVLSDLWCRGPEGWRIWRRHSTPLSARGLLDAD